MKTLLDDGHIEPLAMRLREIAAEHADAHARMAEEVLTQAEYFTTNAGRMRYPEFREQGFFVGSGVIEAGCKSVIGVRLKRSGMFWTVRGANAIIALRCCRLNGRFEGYWEEGRASRSCLALTFMSHTRRSIRSCRGKVRFEPAAEPKETTLPGLSCISTAV
jgi:hypothetical protein